MSAVPEMPRGLRNANPGNIRRSPIQWLGLAETQTDPDYFQFTDPKYGIRAMARILKTYRREGVSTIGEAIARWAPASDNNDTKAYIKDVCDACQVLPGDTVDLIGLLPKLIPAIILHENGQQPYSDQLISYAIGLA